LLVSLTAIQYVLTSFFFKTRINLFPSNNLKRFFILVSLKNHTINYPTPINLGYIFNFGFLSGICLGIQILSGIFLTMHYTPHTDLAFNSVEHIMRDVQYG